jgi:putative ABC transport system permease protein
MWQRMSWAWRNAWRKPLRSTLLLAGTAITASMLFLSYFFLASIDRSTEASAARFGADVMVVPKHYGAVAEQVMISGNISSFYMGADVLDKLRKIPEIERLSPQLYLQTYSGVCCQVEGEFPVIAYDPGTDFTLRAFLSDAGKPITPDSIVIGSEAGGKNAIYHLQYKTYSERITLYKHDFKVARVLFPTGTGADRTIFMTLPAVRELQHDGSEGLKNVPPNSISVVLVKTRRGDEEFVKRQIERTVPEVSAVTGLNVRETVERQLFPLRLFSYSMIVLVILMSALQVMTLFSALVSERQREIGMFRALGARKGTVYRLLLSEALQISVVGAAIGVFLVAAMLNDNQAVITKTFQLPLLFPEVGDTLLLSLAAVFATALVAMLAAAVPVRGILRQPPYEAIREGE